MGCLAFDMGAPQFNLSNGMVKYAFDDRGSFINYPGFICSPFVTVQAAAPDPRIDQVDRVISLTKALVKGVEQCFNPSHTKGNTAAKNRLIKLGIQP